MNSRLPSVRPQAAAIILGFGTIACIVGACSSSTDQKAACTAAPSESVVVAVRDSATGLPAADGAIGTLVGGAVSDTLVHVDSLTIRGGDQTGTFDVAIEKTGYARWTANDVRVTQVGECGNVLPVQLTALLQAAAP